MVTAPPILLCDEPTSGLDPITAAQMDALLVTLKNKNPQMTIVVVSHDLESLYAIADHAMVLNAGSIAFNGSKDELKQSQDPFLKRFLDRTIIHTDSSKDLRFMLQPETEKMVKNALDDWLGRN
jgi:phospholipid/cholesterol/gamma-HCH transport system ATP-binding protein